MSEASVYELKRRRAARMYAAGMIGEAEYKALCDQANADEQEEIRTLQNAIKQTRLNR